MDDYLIERIEEYSTEQLLDEIAKRHDVMFAVCWSAADEEMAPMRYKGPGRFIATLTTGALERAIKSIEGDSSE